jgi:protein gp37
MGENTKIEWAHATFNAWLGCTKVSPACDNCYAEALVTRRLGVGWGPHAARRRTAESTWRQPLAWDRRAGREGRRLRVFCSSLADVFDNKAPEGARDDLWELIAQTPNLDWMLLTKRPQNIARMLPPGWGDGWPNVWLGATVEDQEEAERRIPHLLRVPAAVHFLSCEPLLGPLDLRRVALGDGAFLDALTGRHSAEIAFEGGPGHAQDAIRRLPVLPPALPAVDWVIAGGESGPGARPTHPAWALLLRDQCVATFVPFFWKQNGEWVPAPEGDGGGYAGHRARGARDLHVWPDGIGCERVGKTRAGALLDGKHHRAFPRRATEHANA